MSWLRVSTAWDLGGDLVPDVRYAQQQVVL